MMIVLALCAITILAPKLASFSPLYPLAGPSLAKPLISPFWFGTDNLGRDIFSDIIWGTRTALMVGLLAAGTSATLGTLVGMFAGFYGGRIDNILMRFTEIFLVIPIFFLALIIMTFFGQSIEFVIIIIGILTWPPIARLVRAEFLSQKEREYVEAARMDGANQIQIMVKEILPNVIHIIIVASTLQISTSILMEAGLSFLGLGDPNVASWGVMLRHGQKYIYEAWWLIVFPGLFITLTALSFNILGDGLNDALNPKLKER